MAPATILQYYDEFIIFLISLMIGLSGIPISVKHLKLETYGSSNFLALDNIIIHLLLFHPYSFA